MIVMGIALVALVSLGYLGMIGVENYREAVERMQ